MPSLDFPWIMTSEGRCDSVPENCFVLQLSSGSSWHSCYKEQFLSRPAPPKPVCYTRAVTYYWWLSCVGTSNPDSLKQIPWSHLKSFCFSVWWLLLIKTSLYRFTWDHFALRASGDGSGKVPFSRGSAKQGKGGQPYLTPCLYSLQGTGWRYQSYAGGGGAPQLRSAHFFTRGSTLFLHSPNAGWSMNVVTPAGLQSLSCPSLSRTWKLHRQIRAFEEK